MHTGGAHGQRHVHAIVHQQRDSKWNQQRLEPPAQLDELRATVPMFDEGDGYRIDDDHTISFDFDGRNYVNLRLVIDHVNDWPA